MYLDSSFTCHHLVVLSSGPQVKFNLHTSFTFGLIGVSLTIGDIKEQSTVEFVIDPIVDMIHAKIHRKNFVEGTQNLSDDYCVTLTVNEHEQIFGKDFHMGETKTLKFSLPVDIKDVINIKLESRLHNKFDIIYIGFHDIHAGYNQQ